MTHHPENLSVVKYATSSLRLPRKHNKPHVNGWRSTKFRISAILIILIVSLFARPTFSASKNSYVLSMLPLFSAQEILARTNPLAEYLKKETGLDFVVEVKGNYDLFTQGMERGIDLAFTNPVYYATASEHHNVLAMASKGASGNKFRGMIVARTDSGIHTAQDLVGARVGYNGPRAGAAYLSQRLTLLERGVDTKQDMTLVKPVNNKQENTLLSVYAGYLDAGFVRESAMKTVEKYIPSNQLKVVMKTAWLPQWALSVSHRMPEDHVNKIRQALGRLTADHLVLKAMKVDDLIPAIDSDYDSVRNAL